MSWKDLKIFQELFSTPEVELEIDTVSTWELYNIKLNLFQEKFIEFLDCEYTEWAKYSFKEHGKCFFTREDNEFSMEVSKRGVGKTMALIAYVHKKILEGYIYKDFLWITPHPQHVKEQLMKYGLDQIELAKESTNPLNKMKFMGRSHKKKIVIHDEIEEFDVKELLGYEPEKKIFVY